MSRFLADLEKALADSAETPPKHMRTAKQIAKDEGLARQTVTEQLRVLLSKGGWIRRNYKIRSGGQLRPVPHYGPKG